MEAKQWLKTKIGIDIWEKKYRFENETFDEWVDRVSGGNEEIKNLLLKKKFLYAGRILSNRKLNEHGKRVTYSNCFFIKAPEDNLESIFDTGKKFARTFSASGGAGTDLSLLRPNNAIVNNSAETTTGSVSFASFFSFVTGLIGQKGRRGASLLSLICTHPDLIEFITAKTDLSSITKANLSIKVTDDFMRAIEQDEEWELSFDVKATGQKITKTVKAREVFRLICETNWDYGEPAMLFWDNVTSYNLMSEDENYILGGVNPCGEQPLVDDTSCLLGSLNLSEFVKSAFTKNAQFKFDEFEEAVKEGVIGLDEVQIEGMPLLPLPEQRIATDKYRQIGLGIMGVADMFIKMGMRYGDKESLALADEIGFTMANKAIETSALIAKERGTFPAYNAEAVLKSKFLKENTTPETYELIEKYGLAHSQILTCAPTGTLSTMLGISGGIEPIYNYSYTRKSESLDSNGDKYYKIYTPIVKQYMELKNIFDEKDLPEFFTNAMRLDYMDRIKMQAVWQKHIDASISSTVNLHNSATVEDVEKIYMESWKHKLKGITIFRDGCKRVGILTNEEEKTIKDINGNVKIVKSVQQLKWGTTLAVSDDLFGIKRKLRTTVGSVYIEGWFDKETGKMTEVFAHHNNSPFGLLIDGMARTMSAGLRTGVSFEYLIHQLKRVEISDNVKENVPYKIAVILHEMQEQAFEDVGANKSVEEFKEPEIITYLEEQPLNTCPVCSSELEHTNGCTKCSNPECIFEACG